jgi:tRNA-2-methylthio-N6-dimethylallyladenosine synthase
VQKLRQADPEILIGTDIIVGFPGETEAQFEETVSLARDVSWNVAFVAIYSPRPGTASWRMYEDDIPHVEKKRRWEILDQMINKDQLHDRPQVV